MQGDTTVAAALLDRLLHHSMVFNSDGNDCQLRPPSPRRHPAPHDYRHPTAATATTTTGWEESSSIPGVFRNRR
ncbi:ATP-binding protein [Kocuria sp. CPCC 205316]|uniref:ATP-binding protein n=1 Tax=Kocuria TaxID=57493 RepID=UPI0036D8F65D